LKACPAREANETDRERTHVAVEPLELLLAQSKDAAQDEREDDVGVLLGVREGEGRAPAPAKDVPALDAELLADGFHVVDERPGRVVFEAGAWGGFAGAAL
jgi:hypothetical protein